MSIQILVHPAQVVEGKLTAGELSSFVIYALYVGSNVGSLASVISNLIQVGWSSLSKAFALSFCSASALQLLDAC